VSKTRVEPADELEIERHELLAGPAYRFEVGRRDFCKLFGSGLVVAFALRGAVAQESGSGVPRTDSPPGSIGAWLHVSDDGTVTVYTGKAEMGQNIRTSLSQVVAEELRVPATLIKMVMADTELTPFDLGTLGSRTTPFMAPQLRKVSAAAREVLIGLAAKKWAVDRASVVATDGMLSHPPTKRSVRYGELAKGQNLMQAIPENVPTIPAAQWTIAGRSIPKVNGREIVTGTHKYTSDIKRPNMVYGKVLRPPTFGATLVSVSTKTAEAMPGVTVVRDGDFVGVAAPNSHVASRALQAIHAEWKRAPQPSGAEIFAYLKKTSTGSSARSNHIVGSIDEGMAAAQTKLEGTYTVSYIAHAPLEPRAAVAEWHDEALTVWTGTQRPFGVRTELAEVFHLPEEKVRVIVPDTGSAYGGKHTGEAAIEAARLAKTARRPVKLIWTREEEFTWAYFRPAGVIDVRSGARSTGVLTAWEFHNYNSGPSAMGTPYEVPHQRIEFHQADSPLRQGSYRGLAATANHFARETHMDEVASALGMDPLEFRLTNLKDSRLRAVLEAAAERFGWAKAKSSPERGFGLACGFEKGGYVAACAEVSLTRAAPQIKIARVVMAFECGAILNPDHLRNQVEGALIMGIGGALFEAIQFEGGEVLNGRFSRYRVPRFSDAPLLETVLLDRKDLPSAGAGETPIVGIAPALGNALFSATGIRRRSLPLTPEGSASNGPSRGLTARPSASAIPDPLFDYLPIARSCRKVFRGRRA
jgi:nicotinate dehydrogenase subunit B